MELLQKPAARRTVAYCAAIVVLVAVFVVLTGLLGPFSASAAAAEPWSFGVMTDTHWSCPTDPAGENPSGVSASIIKQMNDVFIAEGVEFVLQLGDLMNVGGDLAARAQAAQPLFDAGIGFFVMRGNHDIFGDANGVPAMLENFPQNRGLSNTFGATNFSSPTIHEDLNGLSYSFDFGPEGNNARFVIIDNWAVPSQKVIYDAVPNYWYGYTIKEQQEWISSRLDKTTRDTTQAFVFSHHNLMPEYHFDCLFGLANTDLPAQNAFFASLAGNDVRYYFSGHEHLHNRSLVKSPDGKWTVEDIICSSAGSKVLAPKNPASASFFGQKSRQTQISQELNNVGFYIVTVDGSRVTVDYYSDKKGGFVSDAKWPRGEGTQITPTLDFEVHETWGYDQNGEQFLVGQGKSYSVVNDTFEGTTAKILGGLNDCTDRDAFKRPFVKTVNTGWTQVFDYRRGWGTGRLVAPDDGYLSPGNPFKVPGGVASQILTLRGMADFNEVATDVYALSMDFDPRPGAASTLALASLDASGSWVNAVDLNDGGTKTFVKGPWKPQYGLGTYGFDARTGTVWAVLNYQGDFAVAGVR